MFSCCLCFELHWIILVIRLLFNVQIGGETTSLADVVVTVNMLATEVSLCGDNFT